MAVRERAALGVLAGEADRDPLDEQAREGERLGLAPVDPALVERAAPALELLRELRVDGEAVGHAQQLLVQLAQPLGGDGRHDLARRVDAGCGPRARPAGTSWPKVALRRSCAALSLVVDRSAEALGVLLRDDAFRDELLRRTARARSGGCAIRSAISGCVYAGSSCSLWPKRR